MRHLTPQELVDVAEGERLERSEPHLASCDQCRREVTDLRAAMARAAKAEVPEPSPLFWEHFSSRVREAIALEGAPGRRLSLERWSRFAAPLSIGALAAVVIAAALTARINYRPPTDTSLSSAASSATGGALVDPAILPDDPSLDLVGDLSGEIDSDVAGEVGLTTREGAVDKAVMQLTDGERVELQRLLEQELRRSGD